MKSVVIVGAVLLAGCAFDDSRGFVWSWPVANPSPTVAKVTIVPSPPQIGEAFTTGKNVLPGTPLTQVASGTPFRLEDDVSFRARVCEVERAHGMPVLLNEARLRNVSTALGKQQAAELIAPVAKANNAHRCFCASEEERKSLRCK